MLYHTNNSIKLQSFVYIQLNDKTVLFLTIQFSLNHLFALSQIVLFDPWIGPCQEPPLRVRGNLGAMAISVGLKYPHLWEIHIFPRKIFIHINTWVSQMFCNILVTRGTIWQLDMFWDEPHWTMKYRTCLILNKCYSQD